MTAPPDTVGDCSKDREMATRSVSGRKIQFLALKCEEIKNAEHRRTLCGRALASRSEG
jgi:hypothetical protein